MEIQHNLRVQACSFRRHDTYIYYQVNSQSLACMPDLIYSKRYTGNKAQLHFPCSWFFKKMDFVDSMLTKYPFHYMFLPVHYIPTLWIKQKFVRYSHQIGLF